MTGVPEVQVAGIGTALPGPPIDNATLVRRFRLPAVWEQWIDAFVGTKSRHFTVDLDTGEQRYTLADLGATAARRAMAAAGVEPGAIDVVVMGSATPDNLMPATVNMIADRIGVDGVPTFQLLSGCSGAIQALDVGSQLLRSGQYRTALVLGGDNCAPFLDLDLDIVNAPPGVQVNVMLFGDGAGAAVLTTEGPPGRPLLRSVYHRMVGLGRKPAQVVEWYGRPERAEGREPVLEDFKAIEELVPTMAVETLHELLSGLGWTPTDLDYILPPQLSEKLTSRVVEVLGMPWAEEVSCVTDIANTVNALPFFEMEMLLSRMRPGERAAGLCVEASKWTKGAYALELVEPEEG